MAIAYAERVQATQAFTENLRPLLPSGIAEGLLAEAQTVIASQRHEWRRQSLEDQYQCIVDPQARAEVARQQTEQQFSRSIETWLRRKATADDDEFDHEPYQATEAELEQARERQNSLLKAIGYKVSELDFSLSFGERADSRPWNDSLTLRGISDIFVLENQLGIATSTDKIRSWLTDINPGTLLLQVDLTYHLIDNARQGHDRASLLLAAHNVPKIEPTYQSHLQIEKLLDLAIEIVSETAANNNEFDAEMVDTALTVLPYYDRILPQYSLLCARLGTAIQQTVIVETP
jgi:hypothetical protein